MPDIPVIEARKLDMLALISRRRQQLADLFAGRSVVMVAGNNLESVTGKIKFAQDRELAAFGIDGGIIRFCRGAVPPEQIVQ